MDAIPEAPRGCYGLFRVGAWVYVGKGDVKARLLAHLNGDNPCITREKPTHFVVSETADLDDDEQWLIRELKPVCNQRFG